MVAQKLPQPGGKPPQVASGSNRYTIEMQDANEENQLRFFKRDPDSGLPIDYWWIDAGWYPFRTGWWNTGTWERLAAFPAGAITHCDGRGGGGWLPISYFRWGCHAASPRHPAGHTFRK